MMQIKKTQKKLKFLCHQKFQQFLETLDTPLINCEVSLALSWSANCLISNVEERLVKAEQGDNPAVYDDSPANPTFKITDCKSYVPVVTLSAENDNKLLEPLKTGFKGTIKWNKYRSEISNQTKNNNLNYLFDPTFTIVNRLFVLSFENKNDRTSFLKYYGPKIEMKDFNVLIDGKPFFEIPAQNKKQVYEQIIEMSKNNDYTTGNLFDYQYFKDHRQLIAIDLSKIIELENPDLKQQINFLGKLEENNATMLFIIEKKKETTFDFSQNSVVVV